MSGRMEGRSVFVTGAAGGLGRAIAQLFLSEGATVALTDLCGVEEARAELGGRTVGVELDVRDEAAVEVAVEAWTRIGPLDALVNCAGIFPSHSVLEMPVEAWDDVLDTNLKGPFMCSETVARRCVAAGGTGHHLGRSPARPAWRRAVLHVQGWP